MPILQSIKRNLIESHTISIKPISEFQKSWNAECKNKDVKYIYTIKIHHPDASAGAFFSKYANYYSNIIENILNMYSNGKIYLGCASECGYDLQFDVIWNKNRKLK